MTTIASPATMKAVTGEISAGMTTLDSRPSNFTPPLPTAASMAPTMPPMSACDELEGSP